MGAVGISKVCGSGLKAVMLGAGMIAAGDANVVVAGGMENMDLGPYLLPQGRTGYRLGNGVVVDATVHDGLWCAFQNWHMGMAAEFIASEFEITRQMQDEFSLASHQKAVEAIAARLVRRRDRAGGDPPAQGAAAGLRHRRGAASRLHAGGPGQAASRPSSPTAAR